MYRRTRRTQVIAGMLSLPLVFASTTLAGDEPQGKPMHEQKQAKNDSRKQADDKDVCNRVEKELTHNRGIPGDKINVSCDGGEITLKGEVTSLSAKLRAADLAETVRGVSDVENNISVKPDKKREPSQLENDVKTALANDAAATQYDIQTKAHEDGKVTLTGKVDSHRQKQLAAEIVASVNGVTDIDNQVQVKQVDRSDDEIKESVKKTLRRNNLIGDGMIDVQVKDKTVMLSGTVASAAEKTQARRQAWVKGVRDVKTDRLKVERWAGADGMRKNKQRATEHSDDGIAQSINAALIDNPRVFAFNVEPRVKNGDVRLIGTVDNLKAKRAAYTAAMNTSGVRTVDNEIKVRAYDKINDEGLADRIEKSMRLDPDVSSYEVNVDVADGVATLRGTVDSYFEKAEADDIAARITGIRQVDNQLKVNDAYYGMTYNPYADDWYVYGFAWYEYPEPKNRASDTEIAEEIRDELWWSPFVDSDDIAVSVTNGVATLNGTVEDVSEFRSAAENAREGGAMRVVNNLRIQDT